MPFASADANIYSALNVAGLTGVAISPDLRNRETDIPAVTWTLEDNVPTQHAGGSIAPYHARYTFTTFHTTRQRAENLADSVLTALRASTDFQTRENARTSDLIIRGSESVPTPTTNLDITLTFGS